MSAQKEKKEKSVSLRPLSYALMPMSYFSKESRSWFYSLGSWAMWVIFGIIAFVHILFIWYFIDYNQAGGVGYSNSPTLLLSRFEGQIAVFLFSIEFIIAVRSRWVEQLFGGFDRVYKMHGIVGRVGFIAAVMHFLLLIINSWEYAKDFILPSSHLPLLFGQISFWLFVLLIGVTIWVKIPHHIWLWTHKAIGIAFLLSGFHMVLAQPLFSEFDPYRTVLLTVWILGMYCWLYKLFIYNFAAPSHRAVVEKIVKKHNVVDLYLKIPNNKFSSRPGDFVFISLTKTKRHLLKEHHPFSISGIFEGNIIRLSIKDLGDFTHKLTQLKPGDLATIFGPYGKFDDKLFKKKSDMIWIGGGIGIAPFAYMAQQFADLPASGKKGKRKAILFHAINEEKDAIFTEEFEEAHRKDKDFKYKVWNSSVSGYLCANHLLEEVGSAEKLRRTMVFMCGPLPMMHSISKGLIELGVNPRNIIFEEFAFE